MTDSESDRPRLGHIATIYSFELHVFRATHAMAPTIPNIMANGKPSLGTNPRFPLPKPNAYPRASPVPMQARIMTAFRTFHFAPCPLATANAEPKINAASQITVIAFSFLDVTIQLRVGISG